MKKSTAPPRSKWRTIALGVTLVLLVIAISYLWRALPVVSGFGAKVMCSCVFVSGRQPEDVRNAELGFFPISLGKFSVDRNQFFVEGSVIGLARVKAVYRNGFGCTLLADDAAAGDLPSSIERGADSVQAGWPPVTDTTAAFNRAVLEAAIDKAFVETDSSRLIRTRAVVVVYKGMIAAERYAAGFDSSTVFNGWSMAKSVTSALFGILATQGDIDPDLPAALAQWKGDPEKQRITTRHLLQQVSGLEFEEDYASPSHATRMLYRERNMGGYAASLPVAHEAGSHFSYSSGNSNILSLLLRERLGDSIYHEFPYRRLFNRIGMSSAVIETDAAGNFVGSSYVHASARDWARFGLLYLNEGRWGSEQIISSEWVRQSAQSSVAADGKYGMQFWLNRGPGANDRDRKFPSAPPDMFYADGYEGQNIFIIPSMSLVIVRLGLTKGPYFDENDFLNNVLHAFR